MAKIDTVGFARLAAHLGKRFDGPIDRWEMEDIFNMVQYCVADVPAGSANPEVLEELLSSVYGQRKIDAIRTFRVLTGVGLKEAKEAVERHWPIHQVERANLGEILATATAEKKG